jgi:sugar lactone lactonase YvrE
MSRPAPVLIAILSASLPGWGAAPAEDPAPWNPRPWIEKALAAREAKDYAAFRENMESAVRISPGHPGYLYYLAMADALTGDPAGALTWLGRVAEMGMIRSPGEEPAFAALQEKPEFQSLLGRFERNRAPVARGSAAFQVPEKSFLAEGLAYDPVGDLFYVSSVRRRKIVSVSRGGSVRDFSGKEDGLWGAFGMKVDSKRRILWVASSALPEMEGYRPEDEGKAGIFRYDLTTGKLLKKYLLQEPGGKHTLGDLAVSERGDVYVTDSSSPVIYRIRRRKDRLETFLTSGPFLSLQGLDFSEDGKSLYVADYSRGIFRVGLSGREAVLLTRPGNLVLLGIDGLYRHRSGWVAVQNGTRPNRVIRLSIDAAAPGVRSLEILEANTPGLEGPTLGVLVGEEFYYIANSEWEAFDPDPAAPAQDRLREPAIFKLPL